jgi:hypothetical protein
MDHNLKQPSKYSYKLLRQKNLHPCFPLKSTYGSLTLQNLLDVHLPYVGVWSNTLPSCKCVMSTRFPDRRTGVISSSSTSWPSSRCPPSLSDGWFVTSAAAAVDAEALDSEALDAAVVGCLLLLPLGAVAVLFWAAWRNGLRGPGVLCEWTAWCRSGR